MIGVIIGVMIGVMEVSEGVPIMQQKTRTTTNAVDGDFLSYNAEDDLGELDLTLSTSILGLRLRATWSTSGLLLALVV